MAQGRNALRSNFDVDYVIIYRFTDIGPTEAQEGLTKLLKALARAGLAIELRNGDNRSLLIFTKVASEKRLRYEVHRSRVKDWLHGIRATEPDKDSTQPATNHSLTQAERYRLVYHMITNPSEDGGAGITPKEGQWKHVESIFPLHDQNFNKEWIQNWATKTLLKPEDLDEIRDHLGEKLAFYFAFTQSYFASLMFLAAFGFSSWVLLGYFSPVYAVVNALWSVVFVEYWKRQELDLSIRWGVKGVSAIQQKRREFQHEKEVTDPITGETLQVFPATKRLGRQVLQIPFAALAILLLGTLIATCFGIEIFLSEIYSGPFQSGLVFLPTGLLTVFIPTLTAILTRVAIQLNDFENYETSENYDAALTQKIFVLNFIVSYLPIFLTAFIYVPFGRLLVPYLDVFHLTARPFAEHEEQLKVPTPATFAINPARLRKQVIYFTVTAQIVNFAMETLVPIIKRRSLNKYQEMKTERAVKNGNPAPNAAAHDSTEEAEFLARVRNEAQLGVYDVASDLREMIIQYGYLVLFSVVWPLAPVSFFINNWIELRADATKIAVEMQRPTPHRADSIGPWLDSLGFLTWLGSITTSALVYLFSNDGLGPDGTPATIKGWALLLTIFFSEHIFFLVRLVVRVAISKLDSPGVQKERADRHIIRKRYLQESYGEDFTDISSANTEKITRESLEEDARQSSLSATSHEDRFWRRQRSWEESAKVGTHFIEEAVAATATTTEGKKEQ